MKLDTGRLGKHPANLIFLILGIILAFIIGSLAK
jgi:hypothetical protein